MNFTEQYFHIKEASLKVHQLIKDENSPTLIFLHDSLGCIKLWKDFPEKLAKKVNYNVLVYDRQGYGESSSFTDKERGNDYLEKEAEVLFELLQDLEIQRPILFGHSDGGSIAILAAAKYPSFIKGIITEGAHVFVEEITLAGIRQAVVDYQETNLAEKLKKYHADKVEAVFKAWSETWLKDTFRDWNIESFLTQITCPTLIIQGEEDEYGTLEQVESIINQVSGKTEKLIIPKVGHTPHRESEKTVLEETSSFLNKYIQL